MYSERAMRSLVLVMLLGCLQQFGLAEQIDEVPKAAPELLDVVRKEVCFVARISSSKGGSFVIDEVLVGEKALQKKTVAKSLADASGYRRFGEPPWTLVVIAGCAKNFEIVPSVEVAAGQVIRCTWIQVVPIDSSGKFWFCRSGLYYEAQLKDLLHGLETGSGKPACGRPN